MPTDNNQANRSLILGVVSCLLIAAFTWVGYYNSLDVPFTFDDERNIVKNQSVLMPDLSPASMAEAAFGEGNPTPRPVAYLSFGINHAIGELDVTGYHVVNIVIHMLNGWLVYLLALHLCPILLKSTEDKPKSVHAFFALAVALLFVSHPVQTQSVTYIVQRMASLCTLFYLAGMLCYIRGKMASKPSVRTYAVWWGGAFVFWVLALGTKQFAVTLPLAIMLYEWIARGGSLKIQKRTLAVIGGGAALMLLVAVVFKSGLFFNGGTFTKLFNGYQYRDFTLVDRVMTEARIVMHYIGLLVWPAPSRLTLVYDYEVSTSLIAPITTILSIFGLGAMAAAGVLVAKKSPLIAFGILWFMLHLAVESTIIPLELVYEHRLYVPIIGAGLLFAGCVFTLIKNPKAALAAVVVLSGVMLIATHDRNETWRDRLGMWQDNADKQPTEYRAYYNMAVIQRDEGNYQEAVDLLEQTIKTEPRNQQAMVMAAALLRLIGDQSIEPNKRLERYRESERTYAVAISLDRASHPRFVRYHWEALTGRASLYLKVNQYELAADDYTKVLALQPLKDETETIQLQRNSEVLAGRALAYMNLYRYVDAVTDLDAALKHYPDHVQANNNLAWILATNPDSALRDGARAVTLSKRACELTEWSDLSTISTYAASLAEAGDFAAAIEWQTKCITMAPLQIVEQYRDRLELFQNDTPYRSN
jgi:tetratricopeptide (TPR) repeat protein